MRRSLMLLVVCACGGGSTFNGGVQTYTLSVADSAFVAGQEIWLSSSKDLCKNLKLNILPKDGTIAKIIPHPPAVGDFTVDPSQSSGKTNTIFLQFFRFNDTCVDTLSFGPSISTNGTATISDFVDMKSIDGYFDVTFGNSDKVSGTFNAQFCDAPTSYPNAECQ